MKALIESALANVLSANLRGLSACLPQHAGGELPDTGTAVIITAEIEHKGGNFNTADVTYQVETVVEGDDSARSHREYEQAVRMVATAIDGLDCGLGVTLNGQAFFQGQGGGNDGNRWVSTLKYRYGATG